MFADRMSTQNPVKKKPVAFIINKTNLGTVCQPQHIPLGTLLLCIGLYFIILFHALHTKKDYASLCRMYFRKFTLKKYVLRKIDFNFLNGMQISGSIPATHIRSPIFCPITITSTIKNVIFQINEI